MKPSETIKNFLGVLLMAMLGAVVVRLLLPIPMGFTIALILFIFVLETVLKELEKDTATKRALSKIMITAISIIAFVGLRVAIGHIFNMPLVDTYNALEGKGIIGSTYQTASAQFILELLFIIPGYGFARGLVKGDSKTKFAIYVFSLAMFFTFLWQVKQVEHSAALKRTTQASINQHANELDSSAIQKEGFAKIKIAELTENFEDLRTGDQVAIISYEPFMVGAEPMLEVVKKESGVFNGKRTAIPNRILRVINLAITVSTAQIQPQASAAVYKPVAQTALEDDPNCQPVEIKGTRLMVDASASSICIHIPPDDLLVDSYPSKMVKTTIDGEDYLLNPDGKFVGKKPTKITYQPNGRNIIYTSLEGITTISLITTKIGEENKNKGNEDTDISIPDL